MPRVPTQTDNEVQLRGLPTQRFNAPDIGAGGEIIGRSLQRFGNSLAEAAKDVDDIDAMYDEARAKQLDNEYQTFEREQLFGEQGYYTKQNADALNFRTPTEEALTKKREELLAKTQSTRERRMLDDVLTRRTQSTFEGIGRYAQGQAREYAKTQSIARIGNAKDNYIRFIDDPERSAAELATIKSEVRSQAALLGLQDAGVIRQMEFEALSGTHADVVSAKALSDPVAAMTYFEKHRDQIDEGTQLKLDAFLHPKLVERDADAIATNAMTLATPGKVVQTATGPMLLQAPIPGAKSSSYGWRSDPFTGQKKFHQGMDIKAPMGAPAGAAADGTVIFAGNKNDGYGNQVVVRHADGTQSRYAHLSKLNVKNGDGVTRGVPVGLVGSTGRSTGPHLHFEVMDSRGNRMDPNAAIGRDVGRQAQATQAQAKADLAAQIAFARSEVQRIYADKSDAYRDDVEEATIAKITKEHSMQKALESERHEAAGDEAWRTVDALADNFTSVSQIPNYADLSPNDQHNFRVLARSNLKQLSAPEARKTDSAKWATLSDAYAKDPKAFLAIKPEQVRPFLDDGDFNTYLGWRRDALDTKSTGKKSEKWLTESDIITASKSAMQAAGLVTGDSVAARNSAPKVNAFTRKMLEWANRVKAQTGQYPNEDAIRRQGDRFLIEGGWDENGEKKTGFAFEAPNSTLRTKIPPDIRTKIKQMSPTASDAEVQRIYIRFKGIKW